MTISIPASQIVSVTPGVVGAGGTGLSLNGLILTNATQVPVGTVQQFPTAASVAAYFGDNSDEAAAAGIYFAGFDGSQIKPGALLFTQYPVTDVRAYLRGGSLAALTLTQLQALTGVLTITVNGIAHTSGTINLSSATSFSNAAALIQTGLASYDAVVTGSISTTTLTVTAVSSGVLAPGQPITGSGVTANTIIVDQIGGTDGGIGTYTVSISQTASSTTISAGQTTVAFDSVSGAFIVTGGTPGVISTISFASGSLAAGVKLTAATGAVTSQGAGASVPGAFMDNIANQIQNWATFATLFEPDTDDKVAFAEWTNGTDNRFAYSMWDTDVTVTTNADTASAGYRIQHAGYSGTILIYEPTYEGVAIFVMGAIASIDFTQTNGRITLKFRRQSGLVAGVTNVLISEQLALNGYNFYGAFATAADQFVFFANGQITGEFLWIDSYINQIWLNNALQLALMTLLTEVFSIPYNQAGYSLMNAACLDPITAALNAGVIRPGVTLSALQAAEINNSAGAIIAPVIQTRGWYLQIQDASAIVRVARGSPPSTLWYADGQSIQRINLQSLEVQ